MAVIVGVTPWWDVLLADGVLTPPQLEHARALLDRLGGRLEDHLVAEGVLTPDDVLAALARTLGVPRVADEDVTSAPQHLARHLPRDTAFRWGAVPFLKEAGVLYVALWDPSRAHEAVALTELNGMEVRFMVASRPAVQAAQEELYPAPGTPRPVSVQRAFTEPPPTGEVPNRDFAEALGLEDPSGESGLPSLPPADGPAPAAPEVTDAPVLLLRPKSSPPPVVLLTRRKEDAAPPDEPATAVDTASMDTAAVVPPDVEETTDPGMTPPQHVEAPHRFHTVAAAAEALFEATDVQRMAEVLTLFLGNAFARALVLDLFRMPARVVGSLNTLPVTQREVHVLPGIGPMLSEPQPYCGPLVSDPRWQSFYGDLGDAAPRTMLVMPVFQGGNARLMVYADTPDVEVAMDVADLRQLARECGLALDALGL